MLQVEMDIALKNLMRARLKMRQGRQEWNMLAGEAVTKCNTPMDLKVVVSMRGQGQMI